MFIVSIVLLSIFNHAMAGDETRITIVGFEKPEGDFPMKLLIDRHKYNRTHDAFDVSFVMPIDLNDKVYMHAIVYQIDHGETKNYELNDTLCNLVENSARNNMREILRLNKIDRDSCPVEAGTIRLKNYVVDMTELPSLPDGKYKANVCLYYEGKVYMCHTAYFNVKKTIGF